MPWKRGKMFFVFLTLASFLIQELSSITISTEAQKGHRRLLI